MRFTAFKRTNAPPIPESTIMFPKFKKIDKIPTIPKSFGERILAKTAFPVKRMQSEKSFSIVTQTKVFATGTLEFALFIHPDINR